MLPGADRVIDAIDKEMLGFLKEQLRSTWVYDFTSALRTPIHYRRWLRNGCPHPPSGFVKRRILREYAKRFPADVFVETGTYRGGTLSALRHDFPELHSIELNPEFAARARRIFKSDPHITIHEGDSAVVLEKVLAQIKGKSAIFWLDGHYFSKVPQFVEDESPIAGELEHIRNSDVEPLVILIDDVREFDGTRGYFTLGGLKEEMETIRKDRQFYVLDDIIRWHV